ncbi:MAG: alanyl-tRNA editing protein [Clostridia bacterium]|nr:alanyl-tRNA editing protein [Clostridia bacterium]
MTEKLFDTDSYITEFECKVIDLYTEDNFLCLILDRTAFFPEGGGQTCDKGWLNSANVENVQNIGGNIIHFVENSEENVKMFTVGSVLSGKIDFKKRFSDMQQHTGEHIFSGIVHSLYGYNNVGFHLGTEVVTLDFDGELKEDDVCKVENLVNKAVWDNLEIRVLFPSDEELSSIDYRSKIEIEGQTRLVEIPGVDMCACCAPHVKFTGEVGIIEVVNFERYKGGTRLSILCGERALADIRHKLNENRRISVLTKAKQSDTAVAVERLLEENERLKYEINGLNRRFLEGEAEKIEPTDKIIIFDSRLKDKLLSDFTLSLMEKASEFVACFCPDGDVIKYCIASKTIDLRPLCKELNTAFSGRGGGRPEIVQGSLTATEDAVRAFIEAK